MLRISHVLSVMLALSAAVHAAPDKKTQALQLAAESERAYKDGKFEKSAELLRKAHDLYPEPILLYNLGRALEGIGDAKGAVEAYDQYLQEAKHIDDRPAIERRIATLKAQIEKADKDKADAEAKAQQDEKDRLAKEQAEQAEKDRLAKEQADKDRRAKDQADHEKLERTLAEATKEPPPEEPQPSYGPWITLGAGGAIVLGGAFFGWRANANHNDAVDEPTQSGAADLQDSAHTDASVANVMFAVGGAVLIAGAVWEYFDWKSGSAHVQLTPTGAAVTWTWR